MIIVQIIGGLGNQLFQYALGSRLAQERNVPLKLDISEFESYTLRNYRLGFFNISAEIARTDEIERFRGKRLDRRVKRWVERKFIPLQYRSLVTEKYAQFDPEVLRVRSDVYIAGYWNSEKYFKSIESTIREELTVTAAPDALNAELARRIQSANSISLHIRRGDYASNPETRAMHGLLPIEYYQKALKKLRETIIEPHVFIFSDDPQWARDNLKLDIPVTLVDHNGAEKDYEDLRLMSFCKHHIIANSTFSWWGAWLCTYPQKQIFAPQKWFNKTDVNTSDIVPEDWHRI